MSVTFRRAEPQDAVVLAPNLRAADKAECDALLGPGHVGAALLESIVGSSQATAIEEDGEPIGVFGVSPHGVPNVGTVWLVGTDRLPLHKGPLLRQCKADLEKLHQIYPALTNVVHAENEVHIRFLRWLGFKRLGTTYLGPQAAPFIEFARMT